MRDDMLPEDEEIQSAFDEAFDKPVYLDHEPTPEEIILIRLRAVAQAQHQKDAKDWIEWIGKNGSDLLFFMP